MGNMKTQKRMFNEKNDHLYYEGHPPPISINLLKPAPILLKQNYQDRQDGKDEEKASK